MKFNTSIGVFCILTFLIVIMGLGYRVSEYDSGGILWADIIIYYITYFLILGGIIFELTPYIKSKVSKKFDYKKYKEERVSYMKMLLIYTIVFVISLIAIYLINLGQSSNSVPKDSELSIKEREIFEERCDEIGQDSVPTENMFLLYEDIFYSHKFKTCFMVVEAFVKKDTNSSNSAEYYVENEEFDELEKVFGIMDLIDEKVEFFPTKEELDNIILSIKS